MSCVCCNKYVVLSRCEICEIDICERCRIDEDHIGAFTCSKCRGYICLSYKQEEKQFEDGRIEKLCWCCSIQTTVDDINDISPGLGTNVVNFLLDATANIPKYNLT